MLQHCRLCGCSRRLWCCGLLCGSLKYFLLLVAACGVGCPGGAWASAAAGAVCDKLLVHFVVQTAARVFPSRCVGARANGTAGRVCITSIGVSVCLEHFLVTNEIHQCKLFFWQRNGMHSLHIIVHTRLTANYSVGVKLGCGQWR
eukprot:3719918-Rhodomonas_salina.1